MTIWIAAGRLSLSSCMENIAGIGLSKHVRMLANGVVQIGDLPARITTLVASYWKKKLNDIEGGSSSGRRPKSEP